MSEHTITAQCEITYEYTPGSTPMDRDVQPDHAQVDCLYIRFGGLLLPYSEVVADALNGYILDIHENQTPDQQEMRA